MLKEVLSWGFPLGTEQQARPDHASQAPWVLAATVILPSTTQVTSGNSSQQKKGSQLFRACEHVYVLRCVFIV